MDINLLRSVVTIWAYLPARRAQFDDAASLPFREEE